MLTGGNTCANFFAVSEALKKGRCVWQLEIGMWSFELPNGRTVYTSNRRLVDAINGDCEAPEDQQLELSFLPTQGDAS